MNEISIKGTLANNIMMARTDNDYLLSEKALIADAMYAIQIARAEFEGNPEMQDKLDVAMDVVMSYMFHLELFRQIN